MRERRSILSIAFSSLFGQDTVYRCAAHAESSRNRVRRLTAGMHPLRESRLLLVKHRAWRHYERTRTARLPACQSMYGCCALSAPSSIAAQRNTPLHDYGCSVTAVTSVSVLTPHDSAARKAFAALATITCKANASNLRRRWLLRVIVRPTVAVAVAQTATAGWIWVPACRR
jgi:hypothetical protein